MKQSLTNYHKLLSRSAIRAQMSFAPIPLFLMNSPVLPEMSKWRNIYRRSHFRKTRREKKNSAAPMVNHLSTRHHQPFLLQSRSNKHPQLMSTLQIRMLSTPTPIPFLVVQRTSPMYPPTHLTTSRRKM